MIVAAKARQILQSPLLGCAGFFYVHVAARAHEGAAQVIGPSSEHQLGHLEAFLHPADLAMGTKRKETSAVCAS